jgi:hypothetical protein
MNTRELAIRYGKLDLWTELLADFWSAKLAMVRANRAARGGDSSHLRGACQQLSQACDALLAEGWDPSDDPSMSGLIQARQWPAISAN